MDLIFFLLNPALVLLDALVILFSKASIWDFRMLISASRLTNFLASLESLFHLRLSCLLVKGVSNSGCLTSFSRSCSGSQVDICGGRFGSQVDICGAGTGGGARAPLGPLHTSVGVAVKVSVISGPDVHYLGEGLLTQLFLNENTSQSIALSQELLIQAFSCSPFYIPSNKMVNIFQEGDLTPIRHKEFNEFIKGQGFKGRNNYRLRDLKVMFGFNL